MESNIKIIRMSSGEDVICHYTDNANGNCTIVEPMTVMVRPRGNQMSLMMAHWLPVQVISKNEALIKHKDIISIFEPNEDLEEYYINTVLKLREVIKAKEVADKMSDEEIMDVMEALEEISQEDRTLH